ncbi:MAG: ATPase, T2SS/T4P/T4SS family [Halodesulfurarchaeum sp.]
MFGDTAATEPECGCQPTVDDGSLRVDASDCPGDGRLAESEACRHTVCEAFESTAVSRLLVHAEGVDRVHGDATVAALAATAEFATRIADRDGRLATEAREDPVPAASEARGRAGLVGNVADATGFADLGASSTDSAALFDPVRIPSIAASHLDTRPPETATLRTSRVIDSGATVRIYDRPDDRPVYQLEPLEYTLDDAALETLAAARSQLISTATGSPTEHREAVSAVAGAQCPVDTLTQVLRKHTAGYGVFEDLFSDELVSEVFVNAPATENRLFVRVPGEELLTNVRLTGRGTDRLAARLRTESGRAFSHAAPTIDATLSDVGGAESIRVAGVREPASEGYAFALRAEGTDRWRLARLVGNETVSASAAGLLSTGMARGAAMLVAGPRGAGKTTMTSALLWELDRETRLLAIEDTPELPVRALQLAGRDAQRLEAAADAGAAIDPPTALRTALRFGDGALAIGEVRGEEAAVLYEAMRVGAASDTVIGTIHGEGYDGVKERVVADLGVPESSFAVTDLLVTLAPAADGKRVIAIEEVMEDGAATLYEFDGTRLEPTPRLARGNSRFVASIARPAETYADVMGAIESRASQLEPCPLQRDRNAGEVPADV